MIPEALVGLDPVVHHTELLAFEAVHPALALLHDVDEPDLAEHSKVLRDLGLRPSEFVDEPGDVALAVPAGQRAKKLASAGLGDGSERVEGGR